MKTNLFKYLSFLLLVPTNNFSQTPVIDSLKNVLKTMKGDTARAKVLHTMADKLWRIGIFDTAAIYLEEALKLSAKAAYKKGMANVYSTQGIIQWQQGNYPSALALQYKSLKLREEIKDKKGIAISYNSIANVHWNLGDLEEALSFHQKALKIRQEIGDKNGEAGSYNNIGILYVEKTNWKEARMYFLKSLEIREKLGDELANATLYNNLGIVFENDSNFKEALNYYKKSLEIREKITDKNGIANSYNSIGFLLMKQKKHKEARWYLEECKKLALEVGNKRMLSISYMSLANLDSATGNFRAAFENKKLQVVYRDSTVNEANTKKSVQTEMNYEFDKKEAVTKAEQEKKDVLVQAESRRQKLITRAVSAFGVLILFFAVFAYRSYLQKQKANRELAEKNDAIAEQKKIVEHKNLLITDSIEYAKSIQEAILPAKELLNEKLGEWFVLFKPKDVVSGDFYWAKPVTDKIFIAAIDCTGHGVPGAFMSLMAFNMLENIIGKKEFVQPALILDELNLQVLSILNQQTENASAKYGMDIALIELDRKNGKLQYAGAHNPLCVVSEGKLSEIKADTTNIGMARQKFTNHSLPVKKGDMLYIFTDGYPDQKGGLLNKKLFVTIFKDLLATNSQKNCAIQKELLEGTFEQWKGPNEQIDDVLVIGIRV